MTPDAFRRWLDVIKATRRDVRSDADCARLLGISANSVVAMKSRGADRRTALACRALIHGLEPYE